jgi:hypothetical protein
MKAGKRKSTDQNKLKEVTEGMDKRNMTAGRSMKNR